MLWLIIGVLVGVGGWLLVSWTRKQSIRVTWYEWLLGVIALLFALLAIQNFTASFAELEPQAAWILLALFGVPALIFAGVAWFLVWHDRKGVKTTAPAKS